ncbi:MULTISPECIES: helix-turn-helix transcriptional regulator [unclassified Legionella]|uniref:helix-turn-helix transcriptional regulator n=1 Tax=unclassified Legionella TaxID=2622702 RepID=UPI001E646871|nr:helix-turn-helix transcriptional regulator [Legionella sp. 31fI33]MCC5016130.1 helix-turn-helix transcriptional regulator [Legionella sp. 31fI33]
MLLLNKSKSILQEEMRVLPYRKGIKLALPKHMETRTPVSRIHLFDLLKLSMSVYFLDANSTTHLMNQYGALLCGFDSAEDSKGRCLLDVAEKQSALQLMRNSSDVCITNTIKVYEERLVNHEGNEQFIFSVKFPWFNHNNQLVGSAGFSFNLHSSSLIYSLQQIRELGLFPHITALLGNNSYAINSLDFTAREKDCAYWLVRGYSAKQIAAKLGLSFRTIEDYLGNMKIKMNVSSKQALIEKLIDGL